MAQQQYLNRWLDLEPTISNHSDNGDNDDYILKTALYKYRQCIIFFILFIPD